MASSGKFTWRITDFSGRQSESTIYSDVFTVGVCKWRIRVDPKGPKGENADCLSVYLSVADVARLPSGWCIATKFSFTLVNQLRSHDSATLISGAHAEFTAPENRWEWGMKKFKRLTELHDSSKGYLVNDTLVLEAEVEVLNVSPPTDVLMLETYLSNLSNTITQAAQGRNSTGSSFNSGLKSKVPSLKEVKMAKQSLKECLSDLFKLDIKDRLATSLETLSRAKKGLSSKEQRAVEVFRGDFDDFVADFLTFEHENSEFELHKLTRDQKLCSIKNYHETQLSHKQHLDELTKEEEECKRRIEEVKSKKDKLISDWQTSISESEKTKLEYMALDKKLKEAEERKKIAEERMSRSSAAWSSLKEHFAN